MSGSGHRIRLTVKVMAAAKPTATEYTLWDNLLAHFGVRVQPSGVRSYIIQTRVNGRMRKITLGRFPELPLDVARREGAAVLARLWGGEDVTPPERTRRHCFGTSPPATARGGNIGGNRPLSGPMTSTCAIA